MQGLGLDPYSILGLNKSSTAEDIKRQYKKLALIYHPDKNPDGEAIFKRINDAYTTLADVELKRDYDDTHDCNDDISARLSFDGDALSKKYRDMFIAFLYAKRKYHPHSNCDFFISHDMIIDKSNNYLNRINTAQSLNNFFTGKNLTFTPIIWLKPLIINTQINFNLYNFEQINYVYNRINLVHYETKQLIRRTFGISDVFSSKLYIPVDNPVNSNFVPRYIIQQPPVFIPDDMRQHCNKCLVKFTFFLRRHHCRMCGDIQCNDCQEYHSIPHLGYVIPTRICK